MKKNQNIKVSKTASKSRPEMGSPVPTSQKTSSLQTSIFSSEAARKSKNTTPSRGQSPTIEAKKLRKQPSSPDFNQYNESLDKRPPLSIKQTKSRKTP